MQKMIESYAEYGRKLWVRCSKVMQKIVESYELRRRWLKVMLKMIENYVEDGRNYAEDARQFCRIWPKVMQKMIESYAGHG